MYAKSRKLVLASAITLGLASISGAAIADTMSQDITEARQETQIWTTYALSPYLRASDLQVSVGSGAEHELATALAHNIRGVKSVTATDLTF